MSPDLLRVDPFRLLGDPVRLRILRVLARERLNVSELTSLLGLAQSGVSRHVRLLGDGGFLAEAKEGGWTWWALAADPPTGLGSAWPALVESLEEARDEHGDDARLAEILRAREERRVGWGDARRPAEPGRSWAAWARALGHLLPPLDVADLGGASEALTREIARWAGSVTPIKPPLDRVPLEDETVDLALLSQVLHDLEDPRPAIREAVRITRPGGRVLVLDLAPHKETWAKERLGHRRLGLEESDLGLWLEEAGLGALRIEETARRRGNPFVVVVASGVKPGRAR